MNIKDVKQVSWFDDRFYKIDLIGDSGILETRWLPSITHKLGIIEKPFLAKWRGDIGNEAADRKMFESQERGSRIHNAFNMVARNGVVAFNPWQTPLYKKEDIEALEVKFGGLVAILANQDEFYQVFKLKKWLDIIKPTILFAEKTVYSLKNNDAGTLDLAVHIKSGKYPVNGSKLLEIPDGDYICDLKTGNMVSEEADFQTAAYLYCAEEMGLGKFNGTIILHTGSKNRGGIEGLSTLLRLRDQVDDDYKGYRLASDLWLRKHKNDTPKIFDMPSIISLKGDN